MGLILKFPQAIQLSFPSQAFPPILSKPSDVVIHYSILAKPPPPIPPTNSSLSPLSLISQHPREGPGAALVSKL